MPYNSTISLKLGYCIDCPTDAPKKPLIAGRCQFHYKLHRKKISYKKANDRANAIQSQPSKYKQSIIEKVDKEEKDALIEWFRYWMANAEMRCENCGEPLTHYGIKAWHGSQHHILEKGLFPSVQSELQNHAVIGFYCCHQQWHTNYQNAMKMPIWRVCVQRVQPILHLVQESHKILDLFQIQ